MLRSIVALNAVLERLLQLACGLLGIEITLLMFAQVLIRYFGDEPLSWSEEVIRYSFMWCAFLGAALAQRYRWHVGKLKMRLLMPPPVCFKDRQLDVAQLRQTLDLG